MTPGARLAAAIEILDQWNAGAPLERALTNWARGSRFAGSKDRAAIRDHVYDVVRQLGNCQAAGGDTTARAMVIGLLRLQGESPEQLFTGDGYAPAELSVEERAVFAPANDGWRDLPNWLHPFFKRALGDQAEPTLARMAQRAPLFLRVNSLRGTDTEAQDRLANEGILTRKTDDEIALRVDQNPRKVKNSDAYLSGLVEIQDHSAQRAVASVNWPNSGKILDYCAGGGGKSLAIAAATHAGLFAHDANPKRMSDLPARAKRAGVAVTVLSEADQKKPYDAVLCDVPCSGSGTWRRDPEGKWRLTEAELTKTIKLQRDILRRAATLVTPAGQLIYMTCSFLYEENMDQIDWFLGSNADWQLAQSHQFGVNDGSDGFFLAELRLKG